MKQNHFFLNQDWMHQILSWLGEADDKINQIVLVLIKEHNTWPSSQREVIEKFANHYRQKLGVMVVIEPIQSQVIDAGPKISAQQVEFVSMGRRT